MSSAYVIYRILDPRENIPVYVGQTSDIEYRKEMHLRNSRLPLPNINTFNIRVYLSLLGQKGVAPMFEVVDTASNEDEALMLETKWVEKTVSSGYPVLNRWRAHRKLVKQHFSAEELNDYFSSKF